MGKACCKVSMGHWFRGVERVRVSMRAEGGRAGSFSPRSANTSTAEAAEAGVQGQGREESLSGMQCAGGCVLLRGDRSRSDGWSEVPQAERGAETAVQTQPRKGSPCAWRRRGGDPSMRT